MSATPLEDSWRATMKRGLYAGATTRLVDSELPTTPIHEACLVPHSSFPLKEFDIIKRYKKHNML